jgi:glutamate N-acetyltransferase/amino-acid N-acetyltransferase
MQAWTDLDVSKLNLYLDDVWVAKNGGRILIT